MKETTAIKHPIKKQDSTPFLAYTIFSGSLQDLTSGEKLLVNTINQYSYCVAAYDPDFKQALVESDILLPDGVAITASIRFLTGKRVQKIAGTDLHQFLLEYLNGKGGKCFYLGSSERTLQKIQTRLQEEYPSVKAGFY